MFPTEALCIVSVRLLLVLTALTGIYIIVVYIVDIFVEQTYAHKRPEPTTDFATLDAGDLLSSDNEEADNDLSIHLSPPRSPRGLTSGFSHHRYDSQSSFESTPPPISYLDHRTFYKNLNNSSQYLRRDSFSSQ